MNTSSTHETAPLDLITPLNAWLTVVREDDIPKTDLVKTTRDLKEALGELRVGLPGEAPRTLHPLFFQAHAIMTALLDLSARFLWDDYTDSDTDAPCDLEWDVHHLQQALNPSHVFPADIQPAYVMATVFSGPPEDPV